MARPGLQLRNAALAQRSRARLAALLASAAFAVGSVAYGQALSPPGVGSPRVVEIAPTRFLTKDLVQRLSRITAGEKVVLNEGADAIAKIVEKCGWTDPAILVEFARQNDLSELNAATLRSLSGREVNLPGCAHLSPSTALVQQIAPGRSEADLTPTEDVKRSLEEQRPGLAAALATASTAAAARRTVRSKEAQAVGAPAGVVTPSVVGSALEIANGALAGSMPEDEVERRRRSLFGEVTLELAHRMTRNKTLAGEVLSEAQSKSVTVVPVGAPPAAAPSVPTAGSMPAPVVMAPMVRGNGTEQAATIRAELGSSPQVLVSAPVPAHIHPVENANGDGDCAQGMVAGRALGTAAWPFPVDRLLDALLVNAFERERRGRSAAVVRVLIADTGFPIEAFNASALDVRSDSEIEPSQFFTPYDFYTIDDEKGQQARSAEDVNQDGFRANVYGISLSRLNGDVAPLESYRFRDHGMSVASLAIGGLQLNRYRMLRTLPIKLHFANLMDETQPGRVQLQSNELGALVYYTQSNEIDIANLSFSSTQQPQTLVRALENAENASLVVVAAGNDGQSLNAVERWPAVLGGKDGGKGSTIITVGAHREDGSPARFSNFSPQHVDIMAPGCSVPVPVLKRETEKTKLKIEPQHGTSFAAPLVTFTAALLRSEGLKAPDIKRRIVLSANHDGALAQQARFGARLDILTALSVYNDIVVLRAADGSPGERLRGRLNRQQDLFLQGCNGSMLLKSLHRIDQLPRSGASSQPRFRIFARGTSYIAPSECIAPTADSDDLAFFDIDALTERTIKLGDVRTIVLRER